MDNKLQNLHIYNNKYEMCIHVNDYKCLFNSRPWSVLLSQIGNFLFILVCCDLPANSQSLTCLRLLKHLKVNNLLFWFVEHEVSCFSQLWGNWRIYWVDIRQHLFFPFPLEKLGQVLFFNFFCVHLNNDRRDQDIYDARQSLWI